MLSPRNKEKEKEREEMDKTSDPLKCYHFLSLGLGCLTPAQARVLYAVGV